MGRTAAFVAMAFLAGFGIGLFGRNNVAAAPRQNDGHAADLAAIERLHQEDIRVTLLQDPKGLLDIWSEDAVRLNPGGPPAVGRQAIAAENEKALAQYPSFKVLSYSAKYRDTQVEDGLACEWGQHESQYKLSAEAPPATYHAEGFHVLKRQGDGSWRFVTIVMK